MLKHKLLFTALTLALMPLAVRGVNAEEYIITSNGAGSDSDINITSTNTTTVQQNNTTDITNDVDVNANTGNNTANANNSDDVSIQTGDASATTSIENNANSSYANVENCNCDTSGNVTLSNNGAYSDNTINYSNNNVNTVTVNQYANISNNVNGSLNTGSNKANYNNGNVTIDTGDIKVRDTIRNNTNLSEVALSGGGKGQYNLKISGNGAHSDNTIILRDDVENILSVNNISDIYNSSFWDLITGKNEANGNLGDVAIKTGDIDLAVLIENNVNKSKVEVDCGCEEEKPEEEKPEEEKPEEEEEQPVGAPVASNNPPTKTVDKPVDHKKAGEVLSAAIGDLLPATGTPWLVLLILGNLLMLLFGTVLRLRSGRSPGFAYAI